MTQYTRAEFLKLSTLAGTALGFGYLPGCGGAGESAAGDAGPDLVVVNGVVYTMENAEPRAQAFAVRDGRFFAVGSNDDIRNLVTPRTEVVDADGMAVVPGFIDAHSHPASAGVEELVEVNLDLRSIAEIQAALRERAGKTPPGEWVLGFKYDDTKVSDGRRITRTDLDEAVPDHPVRVDHRGGHIAWYNSRAFALARVTVNTPNPPGGTIYKENGKLTGLVAERANALFSGLIPSEVTPQQRQAGVKLISELMTASGLTTVHDASCSPESAAAYQAAYEAGEMRFRVYMMTSQGMFEGLKRAGLHTGLGDSWLRVGGVKFSADGSASGRTMRMSTPYVGRPNDYGILTMTQKEIHEAVEDAHRHGFQVGIHANGDVTIDMVLKAYERVQENWPRPDSRHRIEHCTLVNPDLLSRIKAAGAIPTPFYTYVHYHGNKWEEYGPEKLESMFAHRSFLDHEIPVAGASDYVPGPYEPLMAIQSMVTRTDTEGRVWGPSQKISVDEALRVCTMNGAYASFEEDIKGSIKVGKLADFVILASDPYEVPPSQVKNIEVARTVVGGRTMHPKNA